MKIFQRLFPCATVLFGLAWLCGVPQVGAGPAVSPELLPALAREASQTFRQPSADLLRQQRAGLQKAVDTLDVYLQTQGANGEAWKKYLLWDQLSKQLRSTLPSVAALEEVNSRFSSGELGLEMPVVADVQHSLAVLLPTVRLIEDAGARGEFAGLLSELATLLEAPPHESAGYEMSLAKRRQRIGQILGWLEQRGLAADLVAAVRRRDSHPNLLVRLSRPLLAMDIDAPFDQTGPVRQSILGSTYSGTARTVGSTALTLIPDAERAVLDIGFTGQSNANTAGWVSQGRFGRATIYSRTVTDFQASKQIQIDSEGFHLQLSVAQARISASSSSVAASGLGSRIVRNRVAQSRPQAEWQSARNSELELQKLLDEEVAKLLQGIDRNLPAVGGKPASWRRPIHQSCSSAPRRTNLQSLACRPIRFSLEPLRLLRTPSSRRTWPSNCTSPG